MGKNKISGIKIVHLLLWLMMVGSFVFFVVGEIVQPSDNSSGSSTYSLYEAEWVQIMPNGTKMPVTVPGQCEAEYGEWVTIETMLPEEQQDIWICARSMQQDMKIYVDDELREEYSTLDTQPFGKTSTMTYVFLKLYEDDAGKTLKIEFMSDSNYAGYVSEMYVGERADIILEFYSSYAPSVVVAIILLLIGIFVVFGSMFIRIFYKKKIDLIHLGNAIMIAASWLLAESKMRQFFLPNATIAMLLGFLLIAILPYPIFTYLNSIQKGRYKKAYAALTICTAVNFAGVVLLQVLNIKDFVETMTSSHIIIVASIITMTATTIIDTVKGYVRDYREVAIGFVVLMVSGVFEIGLVYTVSAKVNGISLCVGLIVLLVSAGLKTIRDLVNIEKEKQYAIATSESRTQFFASMSHEIRTPINTIIGMNEMILRENENEEIEEYSYNIKSASQMLLGIINDILDFSKIEAGKLQIVESDYRLADMINDVALGNGLRAKRKKLEFNLNVDETLPCVLKGDEIRIKQILNNLLSNAVKYTEKGNVTFSVKGIQDEEGFSLLISVKDTGIGIKEEDMNNLFSSFQRLELSKNRHIEGTGLGLNITKLLVELMDGTISVESEYGKGSCFTVKLQQKIVDKTAMGNLEQRRKAERAEKTSKEKGLHIPNAKILVVDDTKMNLVVIKGLLKRTGAQLDMAESGNQCFDMTKEKKYDVILMDHMMPEPDGVQTLHMIREDKENLNRETPIVVLTANAIAGMKEEYMAEGFDDYLSKPVEVEKLEEVLERILKTE